MGTIILTYGALLCVLAGAIRLFASQRATLIVITLLAGLLSVIIGVAVWFGEKRRRWILITSVLFTLFLVVQAITEWTTPTEGTGIGTQTITTLAALLSFGMLLYFVHGERPPDFYRSGIPPTPEADDTNKSRNRSHAQIYR